MLCFSVLFSVRREVGSFYLSLFIFGDEEVVFFFVPFSFLSSVMRVVPLLCFNVLFSVRGSAALFFTFYFR